MSRSHQDILSDIYERTNRDDWFDERSQRREKEKECKHHKEHEDHCKHHKEHEDHCPPKQRHTHEYLGSVKIAEREEDPHNHRFAGVTGQAILLPDGNHFHKLDGNTDFYENHFHIVADQTGPAIPVGNGRHVHFACGQTTVNDGHRHEFQFATLIDNPIGD